MTKWPKTRSLFDSVHRLGLRCGEAAGLTLDDIDWETGTLSIHGKGDRIDRLPLPVDVGQALVDYLRHGRPDTFARAVFVRARAPFTAVSPSGLSCIVARAARRAGLATVHAHRLRHTAATRVYERRGEPGGGRPAAPARRHSHHTDLRQDRPAQAGGAGAAVAHRRRRLVTGLEQMVADYLRVRR